MQQIVMQLRTVAPALLMIFAGMAAQGQSNNARDLRAGKLLVAARNFPDPTFAQAVIVLTRYSEDGAMGLMLNRLTTVPVARVVPRSKSSDFAYTGGPVGAPSVYALLRSPAKIEDATKVLGDIYMIAERDQLEKAALTTPPADRFRAYIGYCGWGPGQLDKEVELGAWYIFSGHTEMIFDEEPESLWGRLVALTERQIARVVRK